MKKSKKLEIVLREYNNIRTEIREKQKNQFTMLSIFVSAFGVLLAQIMNLYYKIEKCQQNSGLLDFFILCLIPATISFMGIIWLDQVYRQFRLIFYAFYLEKKINSLCDCELKYEESVIFWEHFLRKEKPIWEKNINLSQIYYGICIGMFFCMNVASLIVGWIIIESYNLVIGICIVVIYIILSLIYIMRIMAYVRFKNSEM